MLVHIDGSLAKMWMPRKTREELGYDVCGSIIARGSGGKILCGKVLDDALQVMATPVS